MTANCWGWVVLVATYLLLAGSRQVRNDSRLLLVLVFVISLHHIVAIVNAYMTALQSSSIDALYFYKMAAHIVNENIPLKIASGAYFYPSMLAFFYKLTGLSLFFGEELSILAFTLSCLVFIAMCDLLGYSKNKAFLVLIYGSLPSVILFCSITMRESWQILFFMLTMYFMLKNLYLNSFFSLFGVFFSGFLLCLFHEGFVIYLFLLLIVFIIFHFLQFDLNNSVDLKLRCCGVFLTVVVMVSTIIFLLINNNKFPELESFYALIKGNAFHFVVSNHNRVIQFPQRTGYGLPINNPTVINSLLAFGSNYVHYMLAPFPWQITYFTDLYPLFETLVRFVMIILTLAALCHLKENKKFFFFLLISYFLMSIIWSLGTFNYGTSMRHQIVNYWLLVLIFGESIKQKMAITKSLNNSADYEGLGQSL